MRVINCPNNWEYTQHANYNVLPTRCKSALVNLRSNPLNRRIPSDTRDIHLFLFTQLTPPDVPYFAGNYRGSNHTCLKFYEVTIPSDIRVGSKCPHVNLDIQNLAQVLEEGLRALDIADNVPAETLSEEDKVYFLVSFACRIFVEFLRVHPYANGNGHIARYIIWAILGRYGIWPKKWPMNDRPPDPPYSDLISKYRDGDKDPFEEFVLKCVTGQI